MGFYGNLTNTARTQFQFDRIYPNRYSMESNIKNDGIYIGRYVLIEYDADIKESNIKIAYLSGNQFFTTINLTQNYVLTTFVAVSRNEVTPTNFNEYYIEENGFHKPASGYDENAIYYTIDVGNAAAAIELNEIIQTRDVLGNLTGQFWKCIGSDVNGNAKFEDITETTDNNYVTNYNIDITYYGPRQPEGAYSRAWDSTVWQKIYAEGEVKYIMIAELNTAAPSFSMSYDAPTQTPLAPHVDASSANNVYRIHLQPTWGFRIKESSDLDNQGKPLHSDMKVYHINSIFDSKTGKIHEFKKKVNGEIYWNNDGFNIEKSNHSSYSENYITISPTGQSDVEYNQHQGYVLTEDTVYTSGKTYYTYNEGFNDYTEINTNNLIGAAISVDAYELVDIPNYDINEFELHLPAIGDAVANFYDLTYGVSPDRNLRYRDTEWKYHYISGDLDPPNTNIGGMSTDKSTLAGSINYLHELEGMILCDVTTINNGQGGYQNINEISDEMVQTLSSDLIYVFNKDNERLRTYYFLDQSYSFNTNAVQYTYQKVNTATEEYIPNYYFTLNKNATLVPGNLRKDLEQSNYLSTKDYYKRILQGDTYKEIGELIDYEPNNFFYKIGHNYIRENNGHFSYDRQYYQTTEDRFEELGPAKTLNNVERDYSQNYLFAIGRDSPLYVAYGNNSIIPVGWVDTTDTTFSGDKIYYYIRRYKLEVYTGYEIGDSIPNSPRIVEKVPNYDNMTLSQLVHYPADLYNSNATIYQERGKLFNLSYIKDTFYYFEKTGTVRPDMNGPTYNVYDYKIDHNQIYTSSRNYYIETPTYIPEDEAYFYYPNAFFYFENDDGINDPFDLNATGSNSPAPGNLAILDNADYPTLDRHYWNIVLSEPTWVYNPTSREWMYIQTILGWERVELRSVTDQWIIYNPQTTLYELSPSTPSFRYYYKASDETDEIYHMIHINNRNVVCSNRNNSFYHFGTSDINQILHYSTDDLYVKNKYYYYNDHDDLILDENLEFTSQRRYIYYYERDNCLWNPDNESSPVITPVQFYEKEKYYYKVGNNYVLDTRDNVQTGITYYEKDVYRVAEDLLGIFSIGSAWNSKVTIIPCTITLGISEPHYELREFNAPTSGDISLNGLLLKYSKMLSAGNNLIRSYSSIQGTLNLYKDTLNKIDYELEPNKLITSDYYGRMTTTNYSIKDLLDRIAQLEARVQALES